MSDSRTYINNEEIQPNVVSPPDGGWGWFVVASSFLNMFLIDGINYTFGIYITPLTEEFNTTSAETALLGSVLASLSYMIGPFVSALLNTYDLRFITIIGTLLSTGGYIGASFATSYWFFFAFYSICIGVGYGLMLLPAMIAPNMYFIKWRALATALASCGTGLGTLALPPLATFLLARFKWRRTLQIMAGINLLFGLFGASYKPLKAQKVVNVSMKKDSFYLTTTEAELTKRRRRCCNCGIYSNKYYPTTAEIVPAKGALLEDFESKFEEALDTVSIISQSTKRPSSLRKISRTTRYSTGMSSMGVSMDFNRCGICWYNCLYLTSCQPCQIDAKPFHRDDIFYNNSIGLMPQYKKHALEMKKKLKKYRRKKKTKGAKLDELENKLLLELQQHEMEYNMDVTRVTVNREHWYKPNCSCALSSLRTLATMLHCDLFKCCSFNICNLGVISYSLGYGATLMYLVDRALIHGIPADKAFWLLSAVGAANTFGRLFSGFLPCVFSINIALYVVSTSVIAAAFTFGSGFCFHYWFQILYAVAFGFNCAPYAALRTVINVELFGLANLNNVFGLQFMLGGAAMLAGPVIAGGLYDYTKNFFWSYIYAGGCILSNAIFLGLAKLVRDREIKEEQRVQLTEVGSTTV